MGVHCFAGCDWRVVCEAAVGSGWREILLDEVEVPVVPNKPASEASEPLRIGEWEEVARYDYRDPETGEVVATKVRYERTVGTAREKEFRWFLPGAEKPGGISGLKLPLYRAYDLRDVPEDRWVYFVEGEKAAEACWQHGLPAVCGAYGSDASKIAHALGVLAGRKVAIWPDNDEPGYAYAAAVRTYLRSIASELRLVEVPLPPKGDAADYFDRGGSPDKVLEASHEAASVKILRDDSAVVTIPRPGKEPVRLTFERLSRSRYEWECTLTIEGYGPMPYRQRINLLSHSARQNLMTELRALYGKDENYLAQWHEALSLLTDALVNSSQSIDATEMEPAPPLEYVIALIYPKNEPSVLYGFGDTGKTYIALSQAVCIAAGKHWAGHDVPEAMPVLWLDWETDPTTWKRRVDRLCLGHHVELRPGMLRYKRCTAPLAEMYDSLDQEIRQEGIGFIVIDSAVMSVAGDAKDEATAREYFSVLRALGRTSLTIAHTAGTDDPKKPFGSVFWRNIPRRTWFAFRSAVSSPSNLVVGLVRQKANEAPDGLRKIPIEVTFEDPVGPVRVKFSGIVIPDWEKALRASQELSEE